MGFLHSRSSTCRGAAAISTPPPQTRCAEREPGSTETRTPQAFRALMEQHVPYVWRVLRSMGVAEHDLPDVCQDTFLVVHRRLGEFEGRSSLRTWICGIALRVASDHRGKAYRRRERAEGVLPEQAADGVAQDDELERRQARSQLARLLEALPAEQRQVFVLFEIEQMQMKDVADAAGCPLSTAYSRLYAARDALRRALTAPDSKVAP